MYQYKKLSDFQYVRGIGCAPSFWTDLVTWYPHCSTHTDTLNGILRFSTVELSHDGLPIQILSRSFMWEDHLMDHKLLSDLSAGTFTIYILDILSCIMWPWAKLIIPLALAPDTQEDQTSPWLVIAGDPGCPGIARHFLAGAELWPVCPLIDDFLVHPVMWTGHPRFPRLKDNQVGPLTSFQFLAVCQTCAQSSKWWQSKTRCFSVTYLWI